MNQPFPPYGRPLRVEGGIKAQSTRGAIGETWWSKRFIAVLESLALGSRLARGRSYARAGQVLRLDIEPGLVTATVQGSRPEPYEVRIGLTALSPTAWRAVEIKLAEQAIFGARLLAGEMPAQIEEVFAAAGTPLFPTSAGQLDMACSCPDWSVPCKHIAATFYLLAEAFDQDPFQILHWRGRDRADLLASLRALRSGAEGPSGGTPARRRGRGAATGAEAPAAHTGAPAESGGPVAAAGAPVTGAGAALSELTGPDLDHTVDRFWVSPVPLPARPPAIIDTDVDLLLRQLPPPPAMLGGAELTERLRRFYATFPAEPPA